MKTRERAPCLWANELKFMMVDLVSISKDRSPSQMKKRREVESKRQENLQKGWLPFSPVLESISKN